MANAKEIQDRMKSINDTLKITNAMYMISSSKLKKSKKMLTDTEPYFFTLQSEMSRILRHLPDLDSIYFRSTDEIPEEIIKSDASQKEPENVPELEAEPEKPGAEPMAAIKMPELNIPASMKNMELSKPPKVEEVAETKLNMDSFDLERVESGGYDPCCCQCAGN
jgi:hypothetical protein